MAFVSFNAINFWGAVTYSNIDVVGSAVRGREGFTELKTNRSGRS